MPTQNWLILALCVPQAAVLVTAQQSTVREAYVFSATHFDLNFTGPPPFSFARNHRVLDAALKLSEEQAGFRYVIENLYLFNQYLRTHPEKLAGFAAGVRSGKFELAAQWSDLLQNLVTGEDLSRNILLAREFARNTLGADVRVQSLSDIPGQTVQEPQILRQSGLEGLIISRAGPRDAPLFEWLGLDGSRLRVASLPLSYAGGYLFGLGESLEAMEGTKLAQFELSDISADIMVNKITQPAGLEQSLRNTYRGGLDRALIEVSWDNMMPPANLSANMALWNEKHGDRLRLISMLPGDFFRSQWPAKVLTKTGEIPSVWFNGGWTLIGGYQKHIRTSHKLLRAEKWASLAELLVGAKYPKEELNRAWSDHLITLDHEGQSLAAQRNQAEVSANSVIEESCQALASHVRIAQPLDIALVVFNSLNWSRSETVTSDVWLVGDPFSFYTKPYHKLDLVGPDGKSLPFELIKSQSGIVRSIQIRFRAENVPPLGWKTYYLRPSETQMARIFPPPMETQGIVAIEHGAIKIDFDPVAGVFQVRDASSGEQVDIRYQYQAETTAPGSGFFRQKDTGDPVQVVWHKTLRGENLAGPYVIAEGGVENVILTVHMQLSENQPLAISETIKWAGGKKLKLIRQADFPDRGTFTYGVPFGVQKLDDLMPNAGPPEAGSMDQISQADWKKNREIDGWVAWARSGHQVTIASEARGVRFEGSRLKTNLIYSDGSPLLYDPDSRSAPNEASTRLLLSFNSAAEAATRLGWEFYNPLETMISVDRGSGILAPEYAGAEDSRGAVLTTLKKSEDGNGLIAREYATQKDALWGRVLPALEWRLHRTNLVESNQSAAADELLRPFEIRTVRLETSPAPPSRKR